MIGGTDIVIPVRNPAAAMDLAIRAAFRLWPKAVIEDADTGETIVGFRGLQLAGREEILIYRDAQAQAQWAELGADESLDGTMVHLIARNGELTLGVDDIPNPEIRKLVEGIRGGLCKDLFATLWPGKEVA